MLKTAPCLALAVAVVLPGVATAQTSTKAADIAYCKALAAKYMATQPVVQSPRATVAVTASRCATDPVASITTLEPQLQAEGMTLPSRQQAGRQQ